MTDRSELKRLAEQVTTDRRFCGDENHKVLAKGVLALIEQNESLRGLYQMHKATETREMRGLKAERDQLKAQIEAMRCAAPAGEGGRP